MSSPNCGVDMSQEQLQCMLHTILHSADNNERRSIEKTVVRSLGTPATLTMLLSIVQNVQGSSSGVRQLAAVLLRKKVLSLWRAIPQESRGILKGSLLQQLGCEPVKAVRLALAHLVARLARADAQEDEGDGWPELIHAIHAAASDPRMEMREMAMIVACSVAEVTTQPRAQSDLVVEAVLQGMLDMEDSVQRPAVKAAEALLVFLREQKRQWENLVQRLVPQCVALLLRCAAEESKNNLCVDVLDLLEQLLEDLSVKKHGALIRDMALQVLPIFSCKNSQLRVRQSCCDFFVSLVNLKPKFVADTLLDPFVSACVQVMGEDNTISLPETAHAEDTDDEGDHVSDDDDGEMLHVDPPCLLAGRLLSTMATKVSAKAFTGSLLPHISHVTQKAEIAGPLERKAAVLALACLAEGNPGYLRRRVRYVLELTTQLLSDSDPVPREAAAFSLTYFCMHLQPEILIHHRQLFPALVPLLCDNVDAVRRRVARALDVLCENVAEDVEPYVPIILPAVLEAIGCSSLHTQSELCGVISSLATTRCSSFQQHAEKCLELLKPPLAMTSPETILLRAKVIETAGVVAATMEKERFMPHLPFFMERVAENLRTHQAQLREESFGFLSNLCELLQAEFAPYLDESMRCALQTIEDDRAHYKNKHILAGGAMPHFQMDDECNSEQNNNNLVGGAVEGDSDDESHDSDESDAKEVHALVRTADLEEKSSAVYFIGVCAEVLLSGMGSHRIDVCWSALVDLDMHFHSNIRCSTLLSLAKLTQAAHGSGPVVKDVECDTLSSRARGLLDALVNETLIPCMQRETDKEVVAAACDAFELLLKFFGPQVFLTNVRDFIEVITCLLQQRMPCQQEDEDGDDSDLDEDPVEENSPVVLGEDHDGVLMDAVCDMVEAFAKAYGPRFIAYSNVILPLLLPYAALERPSEDIVMATGCIASVLESLGAEAAPFVGHALTLALSLISSTDESAARANCAYMMRVLVESCPAHFNTTDAAAPLLEALWTVAGSSEEIPAAVDNAVSATCSMVRCLSPEAVPLATVLPAILQSLPMRVDKTENSNGIRTIVHVLCVQREFVVVHCWAEMVTCVARILASLTVEEEMKQVLVAEGLAPLIQSVSHKWRETCPQLLSAEQLTALERYGCC